MKEFLPFQLDSENECLWRIAEAGQRERILLTPKSFGVLEFLIEHAGRMVSHEELLEAVWPDTVVEPQAVKKHILDIRNALGDRPKNSLFIETVTKRGYRFIAPVTERLAVTSARLEKSAQGRLVGRDGALEELYEGWRLASQGDRQIVFITGEPGIGKTALVEEFQRQIASTALPVRIARGQCVEGYGGKEAYFPMLDALGQLCRGPQADFIVKALERQAPTWLAQLPSFLTPQYRELLQREILGATRERMLREIGETLEAITTDSSLLLVFEDLQWVDDCTVDLISALARRQAPAKLMLLATSRPLELEAADRPLKALTRDLLVHRLCREIDLTSLSEPEVEQYLAAQSVGGTRSGLASLLHRHTEGNPLFLVAALDHMKKRSLLTRDNDEWRLSVPLGQIELAVPDDLRRMIEAQLERLSPQEQNAMELASIAGPSFSASLLSSAAEVEPRGLEDLFEELSRRRQIVRWAGMQRLPDGTVTQSYEFVHALYRRVLYDRQPPARRARMHHRIAERLETLGTARVGEMAAELAYHFEASADWPRAIDYLLRAAEISRTRYATAQADSILERARELLNELPEVQRAPKEIELLSKLADNRAAEFDIRAIETYETLAARAAHYRLIDVEVRALVGLGFPSSWLSAQQCLQTLERAQQLSIGQHPRMRLRTRASCASLRLWAGGWNAQVAEECLQSVAEIKTSEDLPVLDLAFYLIGECIIRFVTGRYREAYQLALETRARLLELGGAPALTLPYVISESTLPLSLILLGQWGEALQQLAAERVLAEKNENHVLTTWFRVLEAWLHLQAMDFTGARGISESALPLLRDLSPRLERDSWTAYPWMLRVGLICTGSAAARLGDSVRAFEHLSIASREMDSQAVVFDWYWRMSLVSGLFEASLASGDGVRAKQEAERLLDITLATADPTWQGLAWEANARVALANLDRSRARDCIGRAISSVEDLEVPLATWRIHATAARIEEESSNEPLARSHRERSRAAIEQLANSLPAQHPLRAIFVSAPPIAAILNTCS